MGVLVSIVIVTILLYILHSTPFKLLINALLYADTFPRTVGVCEALVAPRISPQPPPKGLISHSKVVEVPLEVGVCKLVIITGSSPSHNS